MKRTLRKILVANRGEIAIRIMRTCREMGIATVAVCSEADSRAPFLRHADEWHPIGPPPARDSYLHQERILEVARATEADAIHPGYGFLSENPSFVEAVERAGLVFIGPSSAAIRLLGDKTSAKALAKEMEVPVVPGTTHPLRSVEEAAAVASGIGYPVLLKAAAGGGGKGMRVVRSEADLAGAFALARSEASSSFSDDRVYLEKYILNPRHVEVQILADAAGSVVHLGERECSIQRRHQKIIEESPSPAIDAEQRRGLTDAAVRLAARAGYTNAGTVEFILDAEGRYYFMEVNTRLQVEHPVTERRTGIDLVAEQIRIAAGEPLRFRQEEIRLSGHALECRVYAEDSSNGFLPSTGAIHHIDHPSGKDVRVDTGIEDGSAITPYYDPMISKVITGGASREEALSTMAAALERYEIYGVRTNLDLLQWVLADPDFRGGRFDTNFLDRKYRPEIFDRAPEAVLSEAASLAVWLEVREERRHRPRSDDGWERMIHPFVVTIGGETIGVEASRHGRPCVVTRSSPSGHLIEIRRPEGTRRAFARPLPGGTWELWIGVHRVTARAEEERHAALRVHIRSAESVADGCAVRAPMPGLIKEIAVAEGDLVRRGQRLVTLEAMKMENEIASPLDGVVGALALAPGTSVEKDQELMHITPTEQS